MPTFRDPPPVTIITGAAGWLGEAVLRALTGEGPWARPGTELRALVHRPADVPPVAAFDGVAVHIGDVADPAVAARLFEGAAGADVLHTAGVIHPKRTSEFEHTNVQGVQTVIAAARAAGARRIVHVSSNSPFGFNPTSEDRFRAEEPFNPYMGYGRSKMAGEMAIRAAHGDGIETTVVRPPWFYGPHQPARQTRFFTAVRTGRFPLVGDGTNRRSMVHVDDLADGLIRAELAAEAGGRAYWVADRRPYPMFEVIETVREALRLEGYEVADKVPHLPALAGRVAERLDAAIQSRGRYVQELHVLSEMHRTIACDVSRAEEELGFAAREALLPGMRESIAWCRGAGIEL